MKNKQEIQKKNVPKIQNNGTVKKQDLLKKMARQYKSMDFDEKKSC